MIGPSLNYGDMKIIQVFEEKKSKANATSKIPTLYTMHTSSLYYYNYMYIVHSWMMRKFIVHGKETQELKEKGTRVITLKPFSLICQRTGCRKLGHAFLVDEQKDRI